MISFPLLQARLPQSCVPFAGSPISCFSPSNFSVRQAAYVDSCCWDSLAHYKLDEAGQYKVKSLWPHKVRDTDLNGMASWLGSEGRVNPHTPSHCTPPLPTLPPSISLHPCPFILASGFHSPWVLQTPADLRLPAFI